MVRQKRAEVDTAGLREILAEWNEERATRYLGIVTSLDGDAHAVPPYAGKAARLRAGEEVALSGVELSVAGVKLPHGHYTLTEDDRIVPSMIDRSSL